MHRNILDRWTGTTAFSCMLIVSAVVVLPVLAIGVLMTIIGGAEMLEDRSDVDLAQAVFALLSIGGVLGFIGYVRALMGARKPERHNVTATLFCLAAGVMTALVVAGFALTPILAASKGPWSHREWVTVPALFAVANLVWAACGVGWMQRLPRRYAERTGRAFDGLPGLLLFLSISLATTATLAVTTL
jgi:hypothetical protein